MTEKFFTKKRRSSSTSEPSSKNTKQTVPWPRDSTPVTTASGARRRQRSSITPSCYTLRQKGTARIARTGYNSLPLRLSHVGWAGTVKPTNRGAREGPESSPQKPSFRSSAQKYATRPEMGDPIEKAWHQTLGKMLEESSF